MCSNYIVIWFGDTVQCIKCAALQPQMIPTHVIKFVLADRQHTKVSIFVEGNVPSVQIFGCRQR